MRGELGGRPGPPPPSPEKEKEKVKNQKIKPNSQICQFLYPNTQNMPQMKSARHYLEEAKCPATSPGARSISHCKPSVRSGSAPLVPTAVPTPSPSGTVGT